MQISEEGVREFQRIWKEDYGQDIAVEFARERLAQLVELYTLLLRAKNRTNEP